MSYAAMTREWEQYDYYPHDQESTCGSCGCGPCQCPDDPEPVIHWHVTAHIPGCLNDTNDGPYDSIEVAREAAAELAATYYGEDTHTEETGNRYEWLAKRTPDSLGGYLISVEECDEPACSDPDSPVWYQ